MKNKRLIGILLTVALLLLIPLISMQFSDGEGWSLFDFGVAGFLLLSTGLVCELVLSKVKKMEYRIGICLGILIVLAVVWVELAVGIFGTPLAGS